MGGSSTTITGRFVGPNDHWVRNMPAKASSLKKQIQEKPEMVLVVLDDDCHCKTCPGPPKPCNVVVKLSPGSVATGTAVDCIKCWVEEKVCPLRGRMVHRGFYPSNLPNQKPNTPPTTEQPSAAASASVKVETEAASATNCNVPNVGSATSSHVPATTPTSMSSKKKKKKKKKAFFANHSLRPLNKWAHKPQPPSSPIKRTAHRCGNNSVPVPSGMLDYLPSPFRSFLWDLPLRELEMRQHAEELRNEGCWRGSNFLVEEAQYLEGFADRLREVRYAVLRPSNMEPAPNSLRRDTPPHQAHTPRYSPGTWSPWDAEHQRLKDWMPSRGSSVGKEGSYFSTDDDNIELPYGHFPAHNDRPPFHWQPSPGSPSPYMHPSGHDALQAYSPRWGPTSPQPPQKRKRPAISLETSTGANTTPLSFNSRWGRAKEEESPPAKRRHTESEQSEEASTEHQSHTPMPENESSADPAPEPMRLHSPPLVPPAEPQSPTAEPKSKTVKTQTESRLKMVLAGDAGGTLDPHKLLMGLYRAQQRATSSSSAKPPTGLDVSNEALASPPREVPIIAIVPATPKSEAPWALATCSSRSGAYRSDALLRPGQAERALMWRERSTRASERLKAAKALKEVGEAEDDTGEVEERQVVSGPSEEDVFRS